ncbi:nucleotidyltransferase domain-containing protein [Candidatus Fermentibacteria bacterium]|nr:nucleotidyltransferase domain-containing protein [Candidatus Fermentibacteria bacterium]
MAAEHEIKEVCDSIVRAFRPERIILFGSHATGTASKYSDVDMLVVMAFEGSGVEKGVEVLRTIKPRIPLDLIVRRPEEVRRRLALHDYFLTQIVQAGRLLYESAHD